MGQPSRLAVALGAVRASTANPNLRRIQLARLASVSGRWGYTVTLAVFAYRASGATGVAIASAVRLAPAAAAAPFAGTFMRSVGARRVIAQTATLRAASLAAAGAAVLGGWPTWAVYTCVAVEAASSGILRPVQNSLLPSLARVPLELTSANLTLSMIESTGVVVGPIVAAGLLQVTSVGGVFVAGAAAYVVSLLLLLRLQVEGDVRLEGGGMLADAIAGARATLADRDASTVLLLYGAQNFLIGALNVLVVVTALDLLGLGASSVGLLTAAIGVGGIVGGGVVLMRLTRGQHGIDLSAGLVLCGVPVALLALLQSEPAALLLLAGAGIGVTIVDVSSVTLLQRRTRLDELAYALGLLQAVYVSALGVGTLLAPLFVATVGTPAALALCGLPLPVLAAVTARRLRGVDSRAAVPSRWTALLRGVPIFAPLTPPALDMLAHALREVTVPAGELVFEQGDVGDAFYVVAEGAVEVVADGHLIAETGVGGWFGEIALLRDAPRMASIRTLTDVLLLRLDRRPFLDAVASSRASGAAADAVVLARLDEAAALGT